MGAHRDPEQAGDRDHLIEILLTVLLFTSVGTIIWLIFVVI